MGEHQKKKNQGHDQAQVREAAKKAAQPYGPQSGKEDQVKVTLFLFL
jgi:hypothetical protein